MFDFVCSKTAMYIIGSTGTENGMQGMQEGWGGMLYFGECYQPFLGMSPKIFGNVLKHPREYRQTFWGTSSNVPQNVAKNLGECPQRFRRMLLDIPGNITKHFVECRQAFWECPQTFRKTFRGMSPNISGNFRKHSVKCPQSFAVFLYH